MTDCLLHDRRSQQSIAAIIAAQKSVAETTATGSSRPNTVLPAVVATTTLI